MAKLGSRGPSVHMEANPNPLAMKFVLDRSLVPKGVHYDFSSIEAAGVSPLAQALFSSFDFVGRVFMMDSFITLTGSRAVDWYEVGDDICGFISRYVQSNRPILDAAARPVEVESGSKDVLFERIRLALDDYVRPAVARDGGAIHLVSFKDGVVRVHLQGACSGCPSATLTLKAGIENLLKGMIPEVKSVEAIPDESLG